MTRITSAIVAAALLLGACVVAADTPDVGTPPLEPGTTIVGLPPATPPADPGVPAEQPVLLGEAYLHALVADVLGEGRVRLTAIGDLPTPCHELRLEAGPPDPDGIIRLEMYSATDPNVICIQVLEPFHVAVEIHRLGAGSYQVLVAGQPAISFEVDADQASPNPRP